MSKCERQVGRTQPIPENRTTRFPCIVTSGTMEPVNLDLFTRTSLVVVNGQKRLFLTASLANGRLERYFEGVQFWQINRFFSESSK
jgi:hypothetical protein